MKALPEICRLGFTFGWDGLLTRRTLGWSHLWTIREIHGAASLNTGAFARRNRLQDFTFGASFRWGKEVFAHAGFVI